MKTLFISDLHLCEQRPDLTAAFLHFLRHEALEATALYILGDLFEFWIGDDEPSPLHDKVSKALRNLRAQGVAIYFIHGNRDFLLGEQFAKRSGLTLLPSINQIDLYGRRTLLLHGDSLCTQDLAYQRFRRITGWRWLRLLFLCLPLPSRQQIARKLRAGSQSDKERKSEAIMDVSPEAVQALMQRYQASLLIHGHTHRPATHQLDFRIREGREDQQAQRIVLGDWDRHLYVLVASPIGVFQQQKPIPRLERG